MITFKRLLLFLFLLCHLYCFTQISAPSSDTSAIHLADPAIFAYKGAYYLYGTVEGGAGNGFLVYTSTNLKQWKLSKLNEGYALKKGAAFGTAGFWAPQVFAMNSIFYIAYVANENIAIAQGDSPLGPFTQADKQPLAAPVKQIDPYLFVDDDGKKYLYHVRLLNGNRLYVAEMNDDLSAIKPETLHECIAATEPWENTTGASWPVAEGPTVLKHKGLYYLFYTANDFRNPDYAAGYATSSSPLGPWTKWPGNPVVSRKLIGRNGTGHGDFFFQGKELYYVFHTHNSESKVGPRKTAVMRMRFVKGSPDYLAADEKSFRYLVK